MARESVWRRRARKCRSVKAEYYPKVDLAELAREADETLSPESFDLPVAAEPERTAAEEDAPAPSGSDDPIVIPLAAAEPAGEADGALRLPEILDLPTARPLARALIERRGRPIVVDGSAVARLGAQCVQVLLSAKRTWGADGVPLSFVNCAPRMIEDLRLLGIDSTTFTSGVQPR
jgi:chemotaxis protein CheX